jgi:hypothetical protein
MLRAPVAFLALTFLACGPSTGDGGGGADARVTSDPCNPGDTRCSANGYQTCQNGVYVEEELCSAVCDPELGCVECDPDWGRVCSGDNVHSCNADGTIGDHLETCELEQCSNGSCSGDDDCAAGADLIYVVDQEYRLWSFDPRLLPADPYSLIGNLDCPAGAPWPEWGGGLTATPFSMSVDRNATAWVLYTSGEIFHVSTDDATCVNSNFTKGQADFKLFGMGFVSDSPGSNEETLFIAGGPVDATGSGRLGRIDGLAVTDIGQLPTAEYSPELTGTGDAELFGYYPGTQSSMVANIVKNSAAHGQSWDMAGLPGGVSAWAFAHWGGEFYIFITEGDGFLVPFNAQVLKLDPTTGNTTTELTNTGKVVVGAGVSTCAPVVID